MSTQVRLIATKCCNNSDSAQEKILPYSPPNGSRSFGFHLPVLLRNEVYYKVVVKCNTNTKNDRAMSPCHSHFLPPDVEDVK